MLLQIALDGDNYVITLSEEFLKEYGWEVGDVLNFEDNGDGSVRLFKATQCWCYNCNKDRKVQFTRVILCPKCGNKRCPHATDHNYECTDSNRTGQPGSRYA